MKASYETPGLIDYGSITARTFLITVGHSKRHQRWRRLCSSGLGGRAVRERLRYLRLEPAEADAHTRSYTVPTPSGLCMILTSLGSVTPTA